MEQIRKRLTYANVASTLLVFLALGGATAFAATELGKNSVGTKQLKKNAVTAAKIKKAAVTAAKVKDGAITGAKIDLATLGTVPSAAKAASADTAAVANSLAGQTTFSIRLGFGHQQTIASNGAVSLVAGCRQLGVRDRVEVLFQTSANGAVAGGLSSYDGSSPADVLDVDTSAEQRSLVRLSEDSGQTRVLNERDHGFVLGPEGKGLVANTEGIVLGLNYGSPGCLAAGVVNAVG